MGQQVPEGWYADPQHPDVLGAERWWNGFQWTAHTRQGPIPHTTPAGPAYGAGARTFTVGPLTPDGARLAERGTRIGAWLIDAVIVTVVATVITAVLTGVLGLDDQDGTGSSWPAFDMASWVDGLVTLATFVTWQWVFLRRGGRTPGKIVLGLRVRPFAADGPLTQAMILKRIAVGATFFAMGAVPYVGFLLGFLGVGDGLAMLTDGRRQALHDRAAGTCVVASERSGPRR